MGTAVEIMLPYGVEVDRQWCRSAWLTPVTGHEEEFLLGDGRFLSASARVTALICRCLQRCGPLSPVDADLVRRLSVGDREAILLHLRRLTLGEKISCVLLCPKCSKKMDLDLSIGELLLAPYPQEKSFHEAEIRDGERVYQFVFRVPNGEDQEIVAGLAAASVREASEKVLRRCVAHMTSDGEELSVIPETVIPELSARMAELDPQAEVLLDLTCPECGAGFELPFDIADFFSRELGTEEREFYRGVHVLSFNYHWDENSILNLGRRKRQIYLELLEAEMSGRDRA